MQAHRGPLLILALAAALALAGCGNAPPLPTEQVNVTRGETEESLSREHPLLIDKDAKTVTLYAQAQAANYGTSTHHGIAFAEGSRAGKALFRVWVDPPAFHDALAALGANAGNNLKYEDEKGKRVTGARFRVSLVHDGKTVDFSDVLRVDPPGEAFDVRFGGNRAAAEEWKTGCILCLDSCPVAITSNAGLPSWAIVDGRTAVTGPADKLPPAGAAVALVYTLLDEAK